MDLYLVRDGKSKSNEASEQGGVYIQMVIKCRPRIKVRSQFYKFQKPDRLDRTISVDSQLYVVLTKSEVNNAKLISFDEPSSSLFLIRIQNYWELIYRKQTIDEL